MNSKIEGFRKLGIGMTVICIIVCKAELSLEKAITIAVIAIVGIICQCILDWRKDASSYKNGKKEKQSGT